MYHGFWHEIRIKSLELLSRDPLKKNEPRTYGGHVFPRPPFTLVTVVGVQLQDVGV